MLVTLCLGAWNSSLPLGVFMQTYAYLLYAQYVKPVQENPCDHKNHKLGAQRNARQSENQRYKESDESTALPLFPAE